MQNERFHPFYELDKLEKPNWSCMVQWRRFLTCRVFRLWHREPWEEVYVELVELVVHRQCQYRFGGYRNILNRMTMMQRCHGDRRVTASSHLKILWGSPVVRTFEQRVHVHVRKTRFFINWHFCFPNGSNFVLRRMISSWTSDISSIGSTTWSEGIWSITQEVDEVT